MNKPVPIVDKQYFMAYFDNDVPSYCHYKGRVTLMSDQPDPDCGYLFKLDDRDKAFPYQTEAFFPWESVVTMIEE